MNSPNSNQRAVVSVLMATRDEAPYLREAVESILSQSFKDFQYIIINNGVTDIAREYLSSLTDPRIFIIHNKENVGLTHALNQGLAIATGEYIARMDDDDVSLPDRFATEVDFLETHPQISVVGSSIQIINKDGVRLGTKSSFTDPDVIRFRLTVANQLAHPTVMIRTEALRSVGGYNESFRFAQDLELWGRMSRAGYIFSNIARPLLQYRSHGTSSTLGATRSEAYKFGIAAMRSNLAPYVSVTDAEFDTWLSACIQLKVTHFHALRTVLRIWATLERTYIALEKPSPATNVHIRKLITQQRRAAIKMYLKAKLGGGYTVLKYLNGR